MKEESKKEKVILVIRDGWGYRKSKRLNAIARAKTPYDDDLRKNYPWIIIKASGEAVGLPKNYQGNSEVGHLTIGSGRIIDQSLVRINKSIKNGSFFKKEALIRAIENCCRKNSKLHLIGLLQKEGVHSHMDHLFALLDFCRKKSFKSVFIHVITDGRDAPVRKGKSYLKELVEKMNSLGLGEVVTVCGRYYAMDRDKRWTRTKKAYQAIVQGKSRERFNNPLKKLNECYLKGETDEFILPTVRESYRGMKDGDSVIFYNLRTDRPRQLTQAIIDKNFKGWKRKPPEVFFVAMTDYYQSMRAEVIFKERKIKNILGEVLSKKNLKQFRISETEKYPHVTFFFNAQQEKPFKGEERSMIPSPGVATYDKKPEMSIDGIVVEAEKAINKKRYQFMVINLVNADMVGHTGNEKAIIRAVEAVDRATGRLVRAGLKNNYSLFIFADHGNAEDQTKEWRTSHTVNPVPLIFVSGKRKFSLEKNKELKDIAPTVLSLMGIKKPKEMDGRPIYSKLPS